MRTPLTIAIFLLFSFVSPAQSKTPPKPVPVKNGEQKKQDKTKVVKAGQKKEDPKKQDPKKGDPKKGDPKKGDAKKGDPKVVDDEGEIPAGSDPADLRAAKSAQDMLKAEKRLAALLKAGKIKGIDQVLPFEEIASWPYEDGLKGMPKKLKKLDGKKVMMTGFMLPIDEVENIKEFLLVQSLWSCCYGQPPDINGTVRVVMTGKKRIDYKFEPIKIIGTFRIKPTIEDGFCVDIYQLDTSDVQVIK